MGKKTLFIISNESWRRSERCRSIFKRKYVNVVDLINSILTSSFYLHLFATYLQNRRRYNRERASQCLEIIQFIYSFATLIRTLGSWSPPRSLIRDGEFSGKTSAKEKTFPWTVSFLSTVGAYLEIVSSWTLHDNMGQHGDKEWLWITWHYTYFAILKSKSRVICY